MSAICYAGRCACLLLACSLLFACEDPPTGPADGALRVLFIGNSLTYVNDLPDVVEALAEADGAAPLYHRSVTGPNLSLEDHWQIGEAKAALEGEPWDVVVMQQGPSSRPENREHLRAWADSFATRARAGGAIPALYMVWPARVHRSSFPDVVDAYTTAADSAEALLLPAGAAWQAAWRRDAQLTLYGSDGFHPSPLGTTLAALVVYGGLYGDVPASLPTALPVGGSTLRLRQIDAVVLRSAAQEALANARTAGAQRR